eukprot:CAMPEP_0172167784 /NCGR_PEP_ID=MMETSP1050-20130122/9768_1 /TAXON_ID=233186 /ORGANISM="Cryptomonas curvata, Strain CCAP979/52" /LENGTH=62 /DNA_ID=CAMNT_0012838621 /DNA_START=159 /DNA_END=347 /DNA_ORIENTATION=-
MGNDDSQAGGGRKKQICGGVRCSKVGTPPGNQARTAKNASAKAAGKKRDMYSEVPNEPRPTQ